MRSEESVMERVSVLNDVSNEKDEFWIESHTGNKKLEDEYLLGDVIGRGASSVVYKCLRKGRTEWACKILKKTRLNKKAVQSEIFNLLKLKHPNIVKMKEVFESKDEIQLILEMVHGGELFERIVERGQYSEEDAAKAVRHILNALQYLHSNGVIHKDLKPENLLYQTEMEDSVLKITDFGMSDMLSDDFLATNRSCGTFIYSAPEVLLHKEVDSSIDMWSLGVITYIMLCGFEPFWDERGETVIYNKIIEGDYSFPSPWWDEISDSGKELVSKLLSVNPKDRLTAQQALNHPWTLGISTPKLHMNETVLRLREFNARRRFRVATKAVLATRRALNLLSPTRKSQKFDDKTVDSCSCNGSKDGKSSIKEGKGNCPGRDCLECSPADDCDFVEDSLASLSVDGGGIGKAQGKLASELSSPYKENYVGLG